MTLINYIDMKNQFTLAFVFVLMFAIILLYAKDKERDDWEKKVAHYEIVSDSLRNVAALVHAHVKSRDSILLLYMASLDRTLEELNKEARKNSTVISDNARLQESLIASYCRDMALLSQVPSICK